MADISKLSRLVSGLQRQVDLSTNTLVVDRVKFGGGAGTDLSKTILDRLISLQDGSDVAATYHTHDTRYFTETELGSSSASSGSDLIGDDNTYSNFTPSAATVKGALAGIDSVLATGSGRVKITAADTTSEYLDASITAGSGLSKSITNPGASEQLDLAVNVDASTIEINADALRVKDLGITAAKLAADSVITSKILDANVTAAKLATDSVSTIKIIDANVTAAKLASDSVITAKILDANVTNAKIATGVDAAKIADGSVSNAEFQYIGGLTSDAQTQITARALDSAVIKKDGSVAFTAAQSMGGFKLTNLAAGTSGSDAVNKSQMDAALEGLKPKTAARAATTANIVIATALNSGDTIDGVTLADGDRVLVKDQSAPAENGIYVVGATPARSTDFDSVSPIDEINGAMIAVEEGTTHAGKIFVQSGAAVAVVGTDPINFVFFSSAATLVGGDGITISGSNISVDHDGEGLIFSSTQLALELDGTTLSKSASGVKVAALGITNAEVSASAAIVYSKLNLSASIVNADVASGAAIAYSKLALSNSIVAGDLTSASVTLAKMASDSVDENKIVSTTMSATGAITGGSGTKLAVATDASTIEISANALRVKDAGITAAKLATDSVITAKILDANVTAAKLAADSVTTVKIVDANITAAKLASDSVITAKILNANVTLAKMASDSVDENKIVSTSHDASMSGGSGVKLSVASSPRGLKSMIAGEAMAADTSFLVRWAISGETAGRVYKADKDASSLSKFMAFGIALKTSAVAAADPVDVCFEGTHTLGASDVAFGAGDIGKAVYLTAAGAFSITPPSVIDEAVWRVGIVESTTKIWVGDKQLHGIN